MADTTPHDGGQKRKRRVCGANRSKGRGPCQSTRVMANGRCRMHGGSSLGGPDSPTWKHGRFSKYKPDHLAEKAATARADPELMDLTRLIADAQAVLDDYMERMRNRHPTARDRETILEWQQHLARLTDMEHRRRQALTETMTMAQAAALNYQWFAIAADLAKSDLPVPERLQMLKTRVHAMRPGGRPMVIDTKAVQT